MNANTNPAKFLKFTVDCPFGKMLFVVKADSEVIAKAYFEMWNGDTFGRGDLALATNDRGRIVGEIVRSSKKATADMVKYTKVIKEEIFFKYI